MINQTNPICLRRIKNDLLELKRDPNEGIGMVQLGNKIYEYLINIKILSGIYEGIILQLIMTIPKNFPIEPPEVKLLPNQNFIGYHNHIFLDGKEGYGKFCLDLINKWDGAGLGWTPAYTLKCVLIQIQNFLGNDEFITKREKKMIQDLIENNKKYTRTFEDAEGIQKIHTYQNPYPDIYFERQEYKGIDSENVDNQNRENSPIFNFNSIYKNDTNENINLKENKSEEINILQNFQNKNNLLCNEKIKENEDEKKTKELTMETSYNQTNSNEHLETETDNLMNLKINNFEQQVFSSREWSELKNNLTCFITKSNYIDDKDLNLGYPIFIQHGNRKSNEFIPIPEVLSQEAFLTQTSCVDSYLKHDYLGNSFKSSSLQCFSNWFPIYLDKSHFEKNKQTIYLSLMQLKYSQDHKSYNFHPYLIFEIIPNILNKMLINVLKSKNSVFSQASIKCYFNFVLLFTKLLDIYSKELKGYLMKIFNKIKNNKNGINKENIPDIGNLFVLLFFSDFYKKMRKDFVYNLFEELIIRQFYWVLHSNSSTYNVEMLIQEILLKDRNLSVKLMIEKQNPENKKNSIRKYLKERETCYPEVFSLLQDTSKNKILDFFYKSSVQGNKLLIISFLVSQKLHDSEFLYNLEKNFGFLSDSLIDEFNKDIMSKAEKTMSLFGLSKVIELDSFFESKRESFDKFLYCYFQAAEKKYVDMVINDKQLFESLYTKYRVGEFKRDEKENMVNEKEEDGFKIVKPKEKKSNFGVRDKDNKEYNTSYNNIKGKYHNGRIFGFNKKSNNNNNKEIYLEDYSDVEFDLEDEMQFFI